MSDQQQQQQQWDSLWSSSYCAQREEEDDDDEESRKNPDQLARLTGSMDWPSSVKFFHEEATVRVNGSEKGSSVQTKFHFNHKATRDY
ncbi:hypothetical protein T05_11578 [Trichinella murrelli]|uniref:Uncharacterized protein n=1 Tax=Trichinella murrelli TaxID=144512 RepID=A0A0V0TSA8_9BILA|nr:hypothetical protein T05_11578 [Trichinella murrelli]